MITLRSRAHLPGVTARQVTDFLLNPRSEAYRAWWPGNHRESYLVRPGPDGDHVGDLVWMDEHVGARRVQLVVEVEEAVPGERLVWRLRGWGVRLPIRVTVTLQTDDAGVSLSHATTAGWPGLGRLVDPVLRLYFTDSFAREIDQHARTEFRLLRDLLCHPGGP